MLRFESDNKSTPLANLKLKSVCQDYRSRYWRELPANLAFSFSILGPSYSASFVAVVLPAGQRRRGAGVGLLEQRPLDPAA